MVGAREAFLWCRRLDLLSLVAMLPLVGGGVTWRGYVALCIGLRTVVDRRGGLLIGVVPSRRTIEVSVALDCLFKGCKTLGKGDPFWC
jgi:hypothetical protein